ncbi:MAG TPA: hypothetical protein VFI73_14585 [Candidatus Nitrosopolaris sp.]|nr:hypothetical protein [Candidatus Nitrosopolaris sp.]
MPLIDAFLLDFETVDFESDSKIAKEVLYEFQKNCDYEFGDNRNFVLDSPIPSAGWYFAKLFLSGQFVKKLYDLNSDQIDNSKGKKFEDKFVSWLSTNFKKKKCEAYLKIASEMK